MDERYISVKVAAQRLADFGLPTPFYLRLEVKFFQLLTAMLKRVLTPRIGIDDTAFDRLTQLVEELAVAPTRRSRCEALFEHLERMIAAVESESLDATSHVG